MMLDQKFTPEELSELKMRLTRALLFVGDDPQGAAIALGLEGSPWATPATGCSATSATPTAGSRSTRSTSTSSGCGSRTMPPARSPGSTPGTPWRWPIYHSGQFKESAQLIDATSILHPDLGGGELQEKFIRLRQRLGEKQ